MNTSELTGPALDWAVATCEVPALDPSKPEHIEHFNKLRNLHVLHQSFRYSEAWSQGGPIIEREKLDVAYLSRQGEWYCYRKNRSVDDTVINAGFGPTPLIAAMRCFVASKLGDEVDVPKELL